MRKLRETDWRAFVAACTPERVIALLDEVRALRTEIATPHEACLRIADRNSELRAEIERLLDEVRELKALRAQMTELHPRDVYEFDVAYVRAALADAAPKEKVWGFADALNANNPTESQGEGHGVQG